jgi:hypothetical protein
MTWSAVRAAGQALKSSYPPLQPRLLMRSPVTPAVRLAAGAIQRPKDASPEVAAALPDDAAVSGYELNSSTQDEGTV